MNSARLHQCLTAPIQPEVRVKVCAGPIGYELIQRRRNREGNVVAAGAVRGWGVLAGILHLRAGSRRLIRVVDLLQAPALIALGPAGQVGPESRCEAAQRACSWFCRNLRCRSESQGQKTYEKQRATLATNSARRSKPLHVWALIPSCVDCFARTSSLNTRREDGA